jgi:cytochrome c peroxidase
MEKNRHLVWTILLLIGAVVSWRLYAGGKHSVNAAKKIEYSTDFKTLKQHVQQLLLQNPALNKRDHDLAALGRKLFFDTRLSKNGQVSCASCHQPDRSFTDGLQLGHGIGLTKRNTPSVLNSFAMYWFFWDGRADSLAAQALGPLEDRNEHGLTRTEVVRHVLTVYQVEYEQLFGAMSSTLLSSLPLVAKPPRTVPLVSWKLAETAASSLTDNTSIEKIANLKTNPFLDYRAAFNSDIEPIAEEDEEAGALYKSLSAAQREALDRAFAHVGLALEAYQKGLVANQSAFDAFAKSWSTGLTESPEHYFADGFGDEEFAGLQLFLGKGSCDTCHSGGLFSDNQFHNIGLPQEGNHLQLGRSRGVLEAVMDPFNCKGAFSYDAERQSVESCKDIPYLDSETPEGLGSFKTPSLRNVSETAPYMHDGRFPTLRHVLDHYNRLDTQSAVGFREETLKPLMLNEVELAALEAFIRSLTSKVVDMNPGKVGD